MSKHTTGNGSVVPGGERAPGPLGGSGKPVRYPEVTLPNGMTIACVNKSEAQLIYRSVDGYFRHGIDIKDGDTVVDVGANIGLFTLAAYDRCRGNVRVYAFEPIPSIFDVLHRNTERCDAAKLKAVPYGLSSEPKTLSFTYFPRATAWSSAYRGTSTLSTERQRMKRSILAGIRHREFLPWLRFVPGPLRSLFIDLALRRSLNATTVTCQVRTLSAAIAEHDIKFIDLLKIDVEKSELHVLQGIEAHHWARIKQIVMEVENASTQFATISALLKSHAFNRVTLDQNAEQSAGDVGIVFASR